MVMTYYGILNYISIQFSEQTQELIDEIDKALNNAKYRYFDEDKDAYNYDTIFDEVHEILRSLTGEKPLTETGVEIVKSIVNNTSHGAGKIKKLQKKYFSGTVEENEFYLPGLKNKLIEIAATAMNTEEAVDQDMLKRNITCQVNSVIDKVLRELKADMTDIL